MNDNISALNEIREAGISANAHPSRILKIELLGDGWQRKTFSGIRLKGHWLTSAGFHPGRRVSLEFPSPGVMELRLLSDAAPVVSREPQAIEQMNFVLEGA